MKRMQRVFGDIDALRFVDNRLGEDRRAAFLAFIADDPTEAARVRTWTSQNEALRSMFGEVVREPIPLWLNLSHVEAERDASASQSASQKSGSRLVIVERGQTPRQRASKTKAVATAALVAVLVSGLVAATALRDAAPWSAFGDARRDLSATAVPALTTRAIEAHQTFATDPVRPVEIGRGQQAQLEQWLRRRLALTIHAPDLSPLGWTFLGGRIIPGKAGPAAFLLYDDGHGERLGLYIGTAAPQAGLLFDTMPAGSVASWSIGPIGNKSVGVAITVSRDLNWLSGNIEPLSALMRSIVEP